MKKILSLVVAAICSIMVINAQTNGFQVHAGVAFPMGDFADDAKKGPEMGAGNAATGFNLGAKYFVALNDKGLSLPIGVDFFFNGLKSDYKDNQEKSYGKNADITFSKYLNIPLTVGLNYQHPLSDKISIFGEVGVGVNYSKITNFKVSGGNGGYGDDGGYDDDDYDYPPYYASGYYGDEDDYGDEEEGENETKYKYDPAFNFCFGLEAGIYINDKWSVSLRYNNLGSNKYKYEIDNGGKENEKGKFSKELPISNLSLLVGFKF